MINNRKVIKNFKKDDLNEAFHGHLEVTLHVHLIEFVTLELFILNISKSHVPVEISWKVTFNTQCNL